MPRLQAAMKTLEGRIRNSSVVLGNVATTPEQANAKIAQGYRALVVGVDWSFLHRGIASPYCRRQSLNPFKEPDSAAYSPHPPSGSRIFVAEPDLRCGLHVAVAANQSPTDSYANP